MTDMDGVFPPEAANDAHVFRKSVPMRAELHEIVRALGTIADKMCLDIGSRNGVLSHYLRRLGGKWSSAVATDAAAESLRRVVGEDVHVLEGPVLPFKKKTFDVVVVWDFLEAVPADEDFIEECHRVLQPDGLLVVHVPHDKAWTLLRPMRALLKLGPASRGLARSGYSEARLFGILKNGFNVHNMRSYSRFFVEFVDCFVRFLERRVDPAAPDHDRRIMRIYSVANPFYWIANQVDMLLFFARGHYLVASAKRRAWRPRNAPVLADGRSISEAVLSRPGA
jgi:SAM-dependent methyltransferase